MLLKDRVILITNVEKFAGHGTTRVALGQGATVLAHDPSFEAPSARRKYETEFAGAHALAATEPATLVELALKRHELHQPERRHRHGFERGAVILEPCLG